MSEIQLGTIRPSGLAKVAGAKAFSVPLNTLRTHAYAVTASMGDDGLTAVALTTAKQIVDRGGRILVIDGVAEESHDGGRLRDEFALTFSSMEHWTRPESLVDLKDILFGGRVLDRAGGPRVAYYSGALAQLAAGQDAAPVVGAIAEAAIETMTEVAAPHFDRGDYIGYGTVPLNLMIVRGITLNATTYSMCRALGVAVLHLTDMTALTPVMLSNCVTSIRLYPSSFGRGASDDAGADGFEATVEIGQYYLPRLHERVDIDASVLSKAPAQLALALGSVRVARRIKWFSRKEPLVLPWASFLQYIRIDVPSTGEAPSTALTISLARQVLAGGGRVIVIDPLAVQGGIIEPFAAQLLHAFPQLRWVDEQEDLSVVSELFDEVGPAIGERIALVTGEPTKPVIKEEGEYGAVSHRPILEAIHMAVFARMLSSMRRTSDTAPVLLVLRNIGIDRRTAMHMADMSEGNVAVMHLDSGRLGDENYLVVGTVINEFSEARRSGARTFSAEVRTHGGVASLRFEYAADVASSQQVRETINNAHLERVAKSV